MAPPHRVNAFVYDSEDPPEEVEAILAHIREREEAVEVLDLAAVDDRSAALREAMFMVKGAVRIGRIPDDLFDDTGDPDFRPGILITEADTGRRSLHIGDDAVDALSAPDE